MKTFCVLLAVVIMALAGGCDLFGTEEDVVKINPTSAQVKVGETVTLTATSSEGRAIIWVSGDEEIATVDGGVVTGISAGTTTITANDGKKQASCELTVIPDESAEPPVGPDPDVPKVTISSSKITIQEGKSATLTAKATDDSPITWRSSDDSIATVVRGRVTGVREGSAVITASSETAGSAVCKVTVSPAPKVVTISSSKATVQEGKTVALTATASDGSALIWESDDISVATVMKGIVTGVSAGTAVITATSQTAGSASCTVTVYSADVDEDGYSLVWSDEFNGNSLDTTKWGYQVGIQDNYNGNLGPEFWGNGELQYYTDGANVKVQDGELQIIAKRENMSNGRTFSSARITTRDKYSVTFGKIEARMKTPAITGMWPAFWMLPQPPNPSSTNNEYGGWPASGELDIMEAKGRLKNSIDTTLHFGGPDWNIHDMAGKSTPLAGGSTTESWHTYATEWTSEYIAWIIDGKEVYRVNKDRYWSSAVPDHNTSAPFDKPYYILLNLAVGGMYDNYNEPPADFQEATMYVDYVRVYQKLN